MMALHRRSRAGPVPASPGKRVPQTRNAQLGLIKLTSESSRMNRQKVVLHIEPERYWTRSYRVVGLVAPDFMVGGRSEKHWNS